MSATGRSWSYTPTSRVSYVRRRNEKRRRSADDARRRGRHRGGMTSNPTAVTVDGLTKRYGARVAVDALTVEIPTGVVAGFIGPNGAGKTTPMAMLLGLVRPSAGTGTVLGHPLARSAPYLGRVVALVEGPAFWPGLTGAENLRLLARLGAHDPTRIGPVLDLVGLGARGGD